MGVEPSLNADIDQGKITGSIESRGEGRAIESYIHMYAVYGQYNAFNGY